MKVLLNGSEIAEFSFRSDIYTVPKYEIDGFELIKGKNDALGFKLKQSGKYELAYYIGGVKFYSFPFDLKVGAADPYSPKKFNTSKWSVEQIRLSIKIEQRGTREVGISRICEKQ